MKKYVISTAILVLITGCYIVCSRIENSSFTSKRIYDRNMILMREICASEYGTAYPIKLSELPRYFIDAVIVTEDKRFYSHIGLDILAVLRAIKQNIYAHRVISGGSTITQQLVRNMYHYPRTVPAKVVETVRAVCIEIRYSKARILEEYLNRIPYGNGAYGVESAARLYFGKPAKDLSLAESAFLCAIPASNKLFNPYKKRNAVFTRQRYVLAQLYRTKKISETEYNIAGKEKLVLYLKEQKFIAPHFCNWVLEKYKNSVPDEIITTLDCDIQNKTEFIVKNHIARLKNANVNNAAVVVVENTTRDVIALVGSSDFFDELNSGQVNGALALRQPGSAIKPFVYGLAFEQGNTPADTISDIDSSIRINENSFFNPQNYDKKYHGPVRLRTALACSYNIATTNLAAMFGTEALLEVLHRARFDSLKNDAKFYGPGLCLGTGEVTLAELARAYCALAMGGRVKELRILKNEPSQEMGRVFKPETAYLLTDILSDNNAREPAFGEFSSLNLPFDCAVKTGTSKNFRDNWTVGYTPRYTVAVWVGNFDGKPMYSVSGVSGAGPVFRDVMLALEIRNPELEFVKPGKVVHKNVCSISGKLANLYCKHSIEEVFVKYTVPKQVCDIHRLYRIDKRNGLIAGDDCPAECVEEKVYEVYPIPYYDWVNNSGLELPPVKVSELTINNKNGRIRYDIESPLDGDIYKIDPVLRREYQVIKFKPVIDESVVSIRWMVDNQSYPAEQYPFTLSWKLAEGKHKIWFDAVRNNGQLVQSNNVNIIVVN